jgi:diguanylate cyclase (GGDEF)-like protein
MPWTALRPDGISGVGRLDRCAANALLEERYRALQRQLPLLYVIALANFFGLYLGTGGKLGSFSSPGILLVGLIVVRLVHWKRIRRQEVPPERVVRELKTSWFFTLIFSAGFSAWGLYLLSVSTGDYDHHVVLFGSLAAVGCAYGLSSFPAAARLPLLLLGLPLALRLILSFEAHLVGMGISLAATILLILRLIQIHDARFTQLVESRSVITGERERARRAERLAKAEKARVKTVADTDSLTGIPNRRAFLRVLGRRASLLRRGEGSFALAMIDLDGFKPINDTFGHATGDIILKEVGARLQAAAPSAMVARTGGDEFAFLLDESDGGAAARAIGAAVCEALQEPLHIGGRDFRITGSCGVTLLTRSDCDVAEALIRADTALYRAKQDGRAGVALFSAEMDEINRRRLKIEQALRNPDRRRAIALVYQPILDLQNGSLRAFEALARWDDPELGSLSPEEFIPIAEQIDVIEALTDEQLASAAAVAAKWSPAVSLSFNISAIQLCASGASARILRVIEEAGLPARRFEVEVTETALLADVAVARANLDALRAAGARILLDDFGAGHASISYLREMPFDGVKLDGSLVASVAESLWARRLLKGVLDLCASLRLPCVAEHIETEEQRAMLAELGCRYGQGFLLAVPLSAEQACARASAKLVRLHKRRAA